jgi:hypothetical protein
MTMKIGSNQFAVPRAGFSVLLVSMLLVACTALNTFAGKWDLTTPRGTVLSVSITQLQENEFYLDAGTHAVSGIYTYDQKLLTMIKPDNPRLKELVWRLDEDGSFVLIREPSVELSGERLISSRLTRPKN